MRIKDVKNYANQMELLGIIKNAYESDKAKSATFQRMAYLVQQLVFHNNRLEMQLEDAEAQYDYMLDLKNKQISNLRLNHEQI